MSKFLTISNKSYLKIREKTQMEESWTSILDQPDWDTKIKHVIINQLPQEDELRIWFEEEFCMNKIIRQTKEIPDLESYLVSAFLVDDKIFAISNFLIPETEEELENDVNANVVFYGGNEVEIVLNFFMIPGNFEKLLSIQPT